MDYRIPNFVIYKYKFPIYTLKKSTEYEYVIGEGRGYTLIHFLSTNIVLSCILTKDGMRILRDAF